jgi:hypothetical protein
LLLILQVFNPFSWNGEDLLLLWLVLIAITSPLGWIPSWLLAGLGYLVHEQGGAPEFFWTALNWLQMVCSLAVGYWQWFVLVPWLWKRRSRSIAL